MSDHFELAKTRKDDLLRRISRTFAKVPMIVSA